MATVSGLCITNAPTGGCKNHPAAVRENLSYIGNDWEWVFTFQVPPIPHCQSFTFLV